MELRKYVKDEIKMIAAANNLSYRDTETDQLVEPTIKGYSATQAILKFYWPIFSLLS